MTLANDLLKQYLNWYKNNSKFIDLTDKIVRIDVPFLDSFSDEITMYAIKNDNGTITLTDDGWTLDNLRSRGVSVTASKTRKDIFNSRIKAFGIKESDQELFTNVSITKFPEGKNRLLQAILAVNDMFMLSKNNAKSLFLEDVSKFFENNNIRATRDVSFAGESGITFNFDFLISGYKEIPTRLIKTITNPNNSMYAKLALIDIMQTRMLRPDSSFYVFLNDTDQSKNEIISIHPEIENLFSENKINTVPFSQRQHFVEELSA